MSLIRIGGLCLFLGLCLPQLHAQVFPKSQVYNLWDGPYLMTLDGVKSARLVLEARGRKPKRVVDLPSTYRNPDFFNGLFRAQEFERLPNGDGSWKLHTSADGEHWNQECTLHSGKQPVVRIFAIGGGKYLLLSAGGMASLTDGQDASCFALGSADNRGVVRLRSVLDMGLKEPYATFPPPANPPAAGPTIPRLNPKYRLPLLGLGSMVVRSPNALAVVCERLGYLWVLDTQKEAPSLRLVRVFEGITEARFATPGRMETAILGIQPRSNGHFLLATRSEEALLAGVAETDGKNRSATELLDKAFQESRRKLENERLKQFPDILWWDLDPGTGKLTREAAPDGLPDKLLDIDLLRKFCFRMKPDGSVEGFY